MTALICFVLAVLASPFKSKSREAERCRSANIHEHLLCADFVAKVGYKGLRVGSLAKSRRFDARAPQETLWGG
jgi:hypothetical protein